MAMPVIQTLVHATNGTWSVEKICLCHFKDLTPGQEVRLLVVSVSLNVQVKQMN